MDREASRAAKAHLVAQIQAGQSWHEAVTSADVQTSRAMLLLHDVQAHPLFATTIGAICT